MNVSKFTRSVALIAVFAFPSTAFVHRSNPPAKRIITVRMVGGASGYRFRPANISAHVGDILRFVNVSGGPHNVAFWEDSIPAGAAARLEKNMEDTSEGLTGAAVTAPNGTYTVSLAGLPPGTYRYYCTPHLGVGMVGRITLRR